MRRFQRKKYCRFCADKIPYIDYKDMKVLRGYITERGKAENDWDLCKTPERDYHCNNEGKKYSIAAIHGKVR